MRRGNALRAVGAAVLAVTLAGCMKMDMQLSLNEDDTVDGSMIFAISKDVAAMAESTGEDMDSLFDEMENGLGAPENAEVEDYEDDDFVGQRMVFENAPLSDFGEEEGFSITHEGDEFVVTGEMPMEELGLGSPEDLGELGSDLGQLGDAQEIMESFDITLSIEFPGEVVEHNGELDGTTVTWRPTPGENVEINARAKDSGGAGGSTPVWLWIVIAAVVVIGLLALLFVLSRNRKDAPEPSGGDLESAHAAPATSTATAGVSGAAGAAAGAAVVPPPPPPGVDTPPVEAHPTEPTDASSTQPTEPEPRPAEPEPFPTEPEPLPTEPGPVNPEPVPTEPGPLPTEPEPFPTEPEPLPSEPEPLPNQPEPSSPKLDSDPTEGESR